MSQDILFKTDGYVFSYRVAGILIKDGCVLLQKPSNDPGYAFPGGHVMLGETNAQTLIREFQEETGMQIAVHSLAWVGELFFPWGTRRCHQICLYYRVVLTEETVVPCSDRFQGIESLEGKNFSMDFVWAPLEQLEGIELYPTQAKEFLKRGANDIEYFTYIED